MGRNPGAGPSEKNTLPLTVGPVYTGCGCILLDAALATMPKIKDQLQSKVKKQQIDSSDDDSDGFSSPTFTPPVHPGTHWPLDATLELLVNYEGVKEVRTVKPLFYPVIYHLTRTDYQNIARAVCKIPDVVENLKTRFNKQKPENTHVEKKVLRRSVGTATQEEKITRIIDISVAKVKILQLLAQIDVKKSEFSQLLTWMEKLELRGGGRGGGELYIFDASSEEKDTKPSTTKAMKSPPNSDKTKSTPPCTRTRAMDKSDSSDTDDTKHKTKISTRNTPKSDTSPPSKEKLLQVKMQSLFNKTDKSDEKPKETRGGRGGRGRGLVSGRGVRGKGVSSERGKFPGIRGGTASGRGSRGGKAARGVRGGRGGYMGGRGSRGGSLRGKKNVSERSRGGRGGGRWGHNSPQSDNSSLSDNDANSDLDNSDTESSSEKGSADKRLGCDLDVSDEFIPNKRFRLSNSETPEKSPEKGQSNVNNGPNAQGQPAPDGPIPMCLYRVEENVEDSPWLPPPKVEIDNAEEDPAFDHCFDRSDKQINCNSNNNAADSSQTPTSPVIRTTCKGPTCSGNNCMYEHVVQMDDSDDESEDVSIIASVKKENFDHNVPVIDSQKEADPIIIIDDD